MKLCGHTMGTPGRDIYGAIDLFAQLGLQGIEIRCADKGHIDLEALTRTSAQSILAHAQSRGIQVACLTPYYKDFGSDQAAAETLEGFRKACRAAGWLQCGLVRAMGGIWPVAGMRREDVWARTVDGLRRAGDIAAQAGVRLAVENHIGTLTMSAGDTARLVLDVDHPSVGILLDYYWNLVAGDEDPEQAIRVQADHILHCHVKNMVWRDGEHTTVLLEDGIIDWRVVIACLRETGYEAYLSDEYEKFWKPEFPEPEIGMRRNAEHLRRCLAD